jgi:protein-tyrosine phosphatase
MHPFVELKIENKPSHLLLTPCPGTKEVPLTDSLKQLKEAGAKAVLTMMEVEEMEKFGVTDIPAKCKELGLEWFHLPIEDDHAPEKEFTKAWKKSQTRILELLEQAGGIVIHCKGGSGRTGLMAGQLLLETGMPLQKVMDTVKSCRPKAFTKAAHVDYIKRYATR